MKKVLIVLTQLYMGGFSKSLINFLLCAQTQKDVSFSLLFLEKEQRELEKDLPCGTEIIRVSEEIYKTSVVDRMNLFYHKCKYVFMEKYYRLIKHAPIQPKYVTEYAQAKNYVRARSLQYDFSIADQFDAVISWEEGFCNYILTERIPAKRRIGFIHPNYLEAHFCKKIDNKSLKKLDAIITISESCFQTLREVFPQYVSKIHYIPNRLNYNNLVAKSQEYDAPVDDSCLSLLTVARVVDHDKAVFRIVELAKQLKKQNIKFKWYIIGRGSDFDEMKRRITEADVTNEVILLGEMANPCPYMKAVDLFVMQSHIEGRPVAVDEALLLGTPALITNYSSAYEQVDDQTTGWVVADDFDSICSKLVELLTNPELILRARENLAQIDKSVFEDCSALIHTSLN